MPGRGNVFLDHLGIVCALGCGEDEVATALFAADAPRGTAISALLDPGQPTTLGVVSTGLPTLDGLPVELRGRNNALLSLALAPLREAVAEAVERHGADRVAVVLGSSTSVVGESEAAHRHFAAHGEWPAGFHYRQQEMGTPASFVASQLGLRGPQYSKMSTTLDDVRLARQLDLPVSVHGGSAAWGKHRPIAQMHECGLLDERTTVVHCNTLADDELQMMADCGCHASLSPDAELQMGFGWPATRRLLDVGIRPSLSIDDCAAVCGDMFRTMHTTLIVQRGLDNQAVDVPTDQIGLALNSGDVVEFATLAGARACGLERRIGTLEVGKEADLLLLRTDELAMFPLTHATGQIVASGHPGLVDTVMVRGRVVKAGGRMVGIDLPRLRRLTLESQARVLERANAALPAEDLVTIGGNWQPKIGAFGADANKTFARKN